MPTLLITGATRGLGLATAHAAAPRAHVLVAGRDRRRTEQAAASVGGEPVILDLRSLEAVGEAAAGLPQVDAVALNAGVQLPGRLTLTPSGFEETFQVNFLAHLVLLESLLDRSTPPARTAFVGSTTHDPAQRTGMPAPPDVSVEQMARGGTDDRADRAAGRRRYTTSKLLITAVTAALGRAYADLHVTCLDPGLMPSTGLTRHYPAPVQRGLKALARPLSLLPFASTPERSGAALASLLLDQPPRVSSGAVVDHRGRSAHVSERARDCAFQNQVLSVSRRLAGLGERRQPRTRDGDRARRS